jgi:hypothetical protein
LVEDAFESLVAAGRTPEEANLARLAENRGEAGGGSQRIGGLEAGDGACRGDELGGQPGPHAGQAADEGRLRVARQQGLQGAVELGGALTRGQGLLGQLPNQGSAGPLAGDRDALLPGGGERLVREDLDAGQAAGPLKVAGEPALAGSAPLGGGGGGSGGGWEVRKWARAQRGPTFRKAAAQTVAVRSARGVLPYICR